MLAPAVLAKYSALRRFRFSPLYGVHSNQPRAADCLRLARLLCTFTEGPTGTRMHESRTVRVRVVPDLEPYDKGDVFSAVHADTIPGGKRTLAAQERDFDRRLVRDGTWGFIVERLCPCCTQWKMLDSCWGFDDYNACMQEGCAVAHYEHAKGA